MNWKKEFKEFIKEENPEYAKEIGYIDLPIEKVQYFIKTLLKKQEKEMIKEIRKKLVSNPLGCMSCRFNEEMLDDILSALKGGGKK